VEVVGAAIDKFFDIFGKLGASGPLGREPPDLLFAWDLTREKQPEETFWEWLSATWSLWEDLLAFWDLFGC
jgi:hypothetical protein